MKSLSRVQLLATPWTAAHQTPLSMGFSRQGYWSGVPVPSLKELLGVLNFPPHTMENQEMESEFDRKKIFNVIFRFSKVANKAINTELH